MRHDYDISPIPSPTLEKESIFTYQILVQNGIAHMETHVLIKQHDFQTSSRPMGMLLTSG